MQIMDEDNTDNWRWTSCFVKKNCVQIAWAENCTFDFKNTMDKD